MRTDTKRVGAKGQRVALMGALLAVVLGGTGCGDNECEDVAACRDQAPITDGRSWMCVENKCVPVDIVPGADAGTDAGTDAGPGTDAGTDAGTDGGTDACTSVPREAKLGTLQLQAGFTVLEAASLSPNVVAVVATPGPTYSLFALRTTATGRDFFALGTWPEVRLGQAALETALAPADRADAANTFASYFLAYDGTRLLAGYTKPVAGFPGSVAVVDPSSRDAALYLSAPGNYTAAGMSDAFFINGGGLDTVSSGLGVYALVTSAKPYAAVKVADFPAQAGGSGFTAISANNIAVFGYSAADTYVNVAHAVSYAKLGEALASRTPVVLANEPRLDVGSDFNAATGFGNGVAVVRGGYGATAGFSVTDVSRFSLTPGLGGGQPLSVGTREAVLTVADTCTSVDLLSTLGSDLLVGVTDIHGRRLVRIRQGQ